MSQNFQRKIERMKKGKAERTARRLFWDALESMTVMEQTFYATLNHLPFWLRVAMAARLVVRRMRPLPKNEPKNEQEGKPA
jgi:hypothetical protein